MDDFTKKDKYSSLNSAIKDIVHQNNDLYQKSLAEKYGFKQEQPVEKTEVNEEVEQLDEGIKDISKKMIHRKAVKAYQNAKYNAVLDYQAMKHFDPKGGAEPDKTAYDSAKKEYDDSMRTLKKAETELKKAGIPLSSIKVA